MQGSTTSDIIIEKLIAWKVEIIFSLVGDGVNPLFEALRKRKDQIRLITVRHEEAAAFMASGYAKCMGKLGVCLATTGPGAIHLMNGLYDAAMEGAPVLAITGMTYHDIAGTQFIQEVDTKSLFRDIAVYNQVVNGPLHAKTVVDLACRAALSAPGLAHISVRTDIQQEKVNDDTPSVKSAGLTGSSSVTHRSDTPPQQALEEAAALLNGHSRIMILAGRGALPAKAELEKLADRLGAPVAKALLGKAVLPDDSPYTTGGIGRLGTLPSAEMMKACSLLLILGSNMPYLEYYPQNIPAIQIDNDIARIGLRYPVTLGIHGDVAATVNALLPLIKHHSDRRFLELAQLKMKQWKDTLARLEATSPGLINPAYAASILGRMLKDDAVISIDTGAHTVFTARHLQIKAEQQVLVCGNLASMGPALPYAIASQLAFPGRQCIAVAGDGGFTMLMGEMATAVLYELPVTMIVFKNNSLAMDRFEQEELGNPEYGTALHPVDFAKIAEACGATAYACSRQEELEPALHKALLLKAPCLVEIAVDPDASPMPPEQIYSHHRSLPVRA